ncbi:hypothetical protein CLV92_105135 [Kineococcus xinjiangensis]|uniref:DUF4190 domain-containing protein n=1 Tax=Kineococcus xinjiangensis TaxID=512762 RepID=A0A2S6IPD8_9ACTN|nr:hypothetical protein [Kineococcus xinjiangensis]PPK96035.1 hypothetical protein CLV92_105135 [Kineococcus xinjiangensis]
MVYAPPAPPSAPLATPRNGLGLAGFVLGVTGVVVSLGVVTFAVSAPLGLAGLVVGCCALPRLRRGEATNGTLTRVGIGLSALALVLSLIGGLASAAVVAWYQETRTGTAPPAPAPPASAPAGTPGATAAAPAPSPSTPAATAPAPSEAAPAADGGTTAAGAVLGFGETATVDFSSTDEPGGRVQVRLDAVDTGNPQDLESLGLGDRAAGMVPHYLRFTVTGVANSQNLEFSDLNHNLGGLLPDGSEAAKVHLLGDFAPCNGESFPSGFADGASFQTCVVYLASPTAPVTGASYEDSGTPYDLFDGAPIRWQR